MPLRNWTITSAQSGKFVPILAQGHAADKGLSVTLCTDHPPTGPVLTQTYRVAPSLRTEGVIKHLSITARHANTPDVTSTGVTGEQHGLEISKTASHHHISNIYNI